MEENLLRRACLPHVHDVHRCRCGTGGGCREDCGEAGTHRARARPRQERLDAGVGVRYDRRIQFHDREAEGARRSRPRDRRAL